MSICRSMRAKVRCFMQITWKRQSRLRRLCSSKICNGKLCLKEGVPRSVEDRVLKKEKSNKCSIFLYLKLITALSYSVIFGTGVGLDRSNTALTSNRSLKWSPPTPLPEGHNTSGSRRDSDAPVAYNRRRLDEILEESTLQK